MTIQDFVIANTERGECKCGKCIDVGSKPDPVGHTVDMVFFKVTKHGEPTKEEFIQLTKECRSDYVTVDPFDHQEHSYLTLGAWIGDQGLAMQYMALGVLLGLFNLLSPKTMLGLEGEQALNMAGAGLLSIQAKRQERTL